MKLSDYITKFETINKEQEEATKKILTEDQSAIFKDIVSKYKSNRYAVLSARSGSGKTVLIRAIKKYCDDKKINCVVTATTGKAASAIGGQTIHSYLGLKMQPNENATNKDEALTLIGDTANIVEKPDIVIIDEASMIGQKLFSAIERANLPFVFFVLDTQQLPPVKEKKVNLELITPLQYTLTKTLRAKEPRLTKMFDDFRLFKEGVLDSFDIFSYINNENIVLIDWEDVDEIPANSECCSVAYRNALVEFLVNKLSTEAHTMYNLNSGITETRMIAVDDKPNDDGYYRREFNDTPIFFNGEDVKIIKMTEATQELVEKGFVNYNGYRISFNKTRTGIMVSAHSDCRKLYNAKEPKEYKVFIKLPNDDCLEKVTLCCLNDKHFVLLWDGTEQEYNDLLDDYFMRLLPHLRIVQKIRDWYRKHNPDSLKGLPYDIQEALRKMDRKEFDMFFSNHSETSIRKQRWIDFLSVKKIVSARKTTSRTIHKAQGISIPAVVITDDSFYGASVSAQYVALTRAKHGVVLVKNTPDDWKKKAIQEDECLSDYI